MHELAPPPSAEASQRPRTSKLSDNAQDVAVPDDHLQVTRMQTRLSPPPPPCFVCRRCFELGRSPFAMRPSLFLLAVELRLGKTAACKLIRTPLTAASGDSSAIMLFMEGVRFCVANVSFLEECFRNFCLNRCRWVAIFCTVHCSP